MLWALLMFLHLWQVAPSQILSWKDRDKVTILSFCEFSGTRRMEPWSLFLKKGITVIFTSSEACGNLHGFIKSYNTQEWVGRQQVFLMLLSGKLRQNRSKWSVCKGIRLRLPEPSSQTTKPRHHLPGKMCFPQPRSYGACTFLRETQTLLLRMFFKN